MPRHVPVVAGLRRSNWAFAVQPDRSAITWWPRSLPGSDLDEPTPPRRRRRPAPRVRRGRIQLVRA